MSKTTVERCRERWEALKSERGSWMNHWQEISEVLLPRNGRFFTTDNNKGDKKHQKILDNTGTRALRTLSGGMMAGLTSPARPWFRLTTLNPELDESRNVKTWMSQMTNQMLMIFNRSNIYRALHMAYEELGAFGTSATVIVDDYDRVIHASPLTVGEYCIATDARGRVETLYREFRLTASAAAHEFGIENCSPRIRQLIDNGNYDEWVTIINAIEPRNMRDPSKVDNKNMPWRSLYFEEGDSTGDKDNKVLRESGFRHFPALCGRWLVTGGDVYGTSPGMEALGDLNQLQIEQRYKGRAIAYQVDPPLVLPYEFKDDESSTLPGGHIFVASSNSAQVVRPAVQVNMPMDGLLLDLQDIRARINEAFYKDIFLMLTVTGGDRMTATEVAERHEEKMLMLGPVLDRLNNEMLDPLISLVFDRLVALNLMPPIPEELQGIELNVEYISILAQAQKAISTNAVDRLTNALGVVAGGKPEVLDRIDADYYVDYYADALGVDPRLIVPVQQAAIIRQQRAEQAAQQQQLANAQQQAAIAKDLNTIESPTPAQLAGQFMGY